MTMQARIKSATDGLTGQQAEFVRSMVQDNVTPTEAARRAGYVQPTTAAWRLTRTPAIMAAVKQAQFVEVDCKLTGIAIQTLQAVMQDKDAPASARVAACRAAFDAAGMGGRKLTPAEQPGGAGVDDLDLASMSNEDLHALMEVVEREQREIEKQKQLIAMHGADGDNNAKH